MSRHYDGVEKYNDRFSSLIGYRQVARYRRQTAAGWVSYGRK